MNLIAAGEFLQRRSRISRRFPAWVLVLFPLGMIIIALLVVPRWVPVLSKISHAFSPATPLSPIFALTVRRWESDIQRWSAGYGLDPNLVATVIQIESCGNANAVSPAGARGLFQVMSNHFSPGEDPMDPETNARRGMEYLATALLKGNGDIAKTLAGYNGGHGVMELLPENWSRETQHYVYWGAGIYEEAKSGKSESERLSEWFAAGGSVLCRRAE
jgi:soluble lytic murein transglycosylase-like protein